MTSAEREIGALGDVDFRGKPGKHVTEYAKKLQRLSRDLAAQYDADIDEASAALKRLGKRHKLLMGADLRIRIRWTTRPLRRARDCALGMSTEAVKFQQEYRKQFLDIEGRQRRTRKPKAGEVDF